MNQPTKIEFCLPIEPIPVQTGGKRMRQRPGQRPIFFKDKKTTAYTDAISLLARQHRPSQPIEGPVFVRLDLIMSRPQRLMRKKDPDGLVFHLVYPDGDNLEKGINDPLTKEGFWHDDGQVCVVLRRKFHAEKTGQPRIQITITNLEYEQSIGGGLAAIPSTIAAGSGSPGN